MTVRFFKKILIILFSLFFLLPVYSDESAVNALTFLQAADLAVSHSADLRSEYKGQKIREKAWTLGFRNYLPRMSLSAQENDRLQEFGQDSFTKSYNVNVDQLLWDGGRLAMSRKLERMDLETSNARLERMADEIAESALSVYRNVLSTRAVLAIRKTALESIRGQIKILEKEVELGLALPLDLAEAELALAEARIEIITLESDLVEMEKQFAELIGLDDLPPLAEEIDVNRQSVLPSVMISTLQAQEKNLELAEAKASIEKRATEFKYASRSWIPTFRLNGSFGVSGNNYPLNRYSWSAGVNIEFASPWLQNVFSFNAGTESPRDRTANIQNNATPVPDPAASLGKKQAKLVLELENEKYSIAFDQLGRSVQRIHEKCQLADRKRVIALEAVETAVRRYRLEEIRLGLGYITRMELMKAHIIYTEKEIAAVEAAVNLLQAEREFERLLNIKPGTLAEFARVYRLSA